MIRTRWRALGAVAGLCLAAELIGAAILLQQVGLERGLVLAAVALVAFAGFARRRRNGGPR